MRLGVDPWLYWIPHDVGFSSVHDLSIPQEKKIKIYAMKEKLEMEKSDLVEKEKEKEGGILPAQAGRGGAGRWE